MRSTAGSETLAFIMLVGIIGIVLIIAGAVSNKTGTIATIEKVGFGFGGLAIALMILWSLAPWWTGNHSAGFFPVQ